MIIARDGRPIAIDWQAPSVVGREGGPFGIGDCLLSLVPVEMTAPQRRPIISNEDILIEERVVHNYIPDRFPGKGYDSVC